jgi:hypothetical protein
MTLTPTAATRKPKSADKPAGYTLVELIVYLVVSAFILLSAIQILGSSQDSSERGIQTSDARQNVRGSIAMMTRELRSAGSGIGNIPVSSWQCDRHLVHHAVAPMQLAQGLTIVGAMDSIGTTLKSRMEFSNSSISCESVSGFDEGDFVVVTDRITAHMFQITGIDGNQNEIIHSSLSPNNPPTAFPDWPANGYARGTSVRKASVVTYYVDQSTNTLMRRERGEDPAFVAGGIPGMELTYRLADGSVESYPADFTQIRAIELTIGSQSDALRHGDYASQILTTTVAPRCIIK